MSCRAQHIFKESFGIWFLIFHDSHSNISSQLRGGLFRLFLSVLCKAEDNTCNLGITINLSRSFGAFNKISRSSFLLCCELNWTQNKTTKSKQPKKLKQEREKKKVGKLRDFWSLISIPSKSWIMNCFLLIKGENNTAQTCQTTQNSPLEAFSLVAQIYIKLFAEKFPFVLTTSNTLRFNDKRFESKCFVGGDRCRDDCLLILHEQLGKRERGRGTEVEQQQKVNIYRRPALLAIWIAGASFFMSDVLGRERDGNDC